VASYQQHLSHSTQQHTTLRMSTQVFLQVQPVVCQQVEEAVLRLTSRLIDPEASSLAHKDTG
jgi:hypothetical protein